MKESFLDESDVGLDSAFQQWHGREEKLCFSISYGLFRRIGSCATCELSRLSRISLQELKKSPSLKSRCRSILFISSTTWLADFATWLWLDNIIVLYLPFCAKVGLPHRTLQRRSAAVGDFRRRLPFTAPSPGGCPVGGRPGWNTQAGAVTWRPLQYRHKIATAIACCIVWHCFGLYYCMGLVWEISNATNSTKDALFTLASKQLMIITSPNALTTTICISCHFFRDFIHLRVIRQSHHQVRRSLKIIGMFPRWNKGVSATSLPESPLSSPARQPEWQLLKSQEFGRLTKFLVLFDHPTAEQRQARWKNLLFGAGMSRASRFTSQNSKVMFLPVFLLKNISLRPELVRL